MTNNDRAPPDELINMWRGEYFLKHPASRRTATEQELVVAVTNHVARQSSAWGREQERGALLSGNIDALSLCVECMDAQICSKRDAIRKLKGDASSKRSLELLSGSITQITTAMHAVQNLLTKAKEVADVK